MKHNTAFLIINRRKTTWILVMFLLISYILIILGYAYGRMSAQKIESITPILLPFQKDLQMREYGIDSNRRNYCSFDDALCCAGELQKNGIHTRIVKRESVWYCSGFTVPIFGYQLVNHTSE